LSTKDAKRKYGIVLETKENRRFDEIFGDENSATIREHKHISGKLDRDQITQFEDNIKIVQHNRRIDAKLARREPLGKSPQDTPLIIEKDGKRFKPNQLMYTFATPEKVVIRLGHLTHATFEDLQKIQRLGIVVEANLTSNQVIRPAGSEEEVQQVLLKFLYNDNKVILNTDGGGVMGTTVPKEYDKAEKAIRKFEAGEIGIPDHQKKVIYFYDKNVIPDLEEKGPTYKYTDYQHQAISEEKKPNFNIERLKQEAERYRQEVVPKVAK
jgi:hypothetical protein